MSCLSVHLVWYEGAYLRKCYTISYNQERIQDPPYDGHQHTGGGGATYIFCQSLQETAWTREHFGRGGGGGGAGGAYFRSTTDNISQIEL